MPGPCVQGPTNAFVDFDVVRFDHAVASPHNRAITRNQQSGRETVDCELRDHTTFGIQHDWERNTELCHDPTNVGLGSVPIDTDGDDRKSIGTVAIVEAL